MSGSRAQLAVMQLVRHGRCDVESPRMTRGRQKDVCGKRLVVVAWWWWWQFSARERQTSSHLTRRLCQNLGTPYGNLYVAPCKPEADGHLSVVKHPAPVHACSGQKCIAHKLALVAGQRSFLHSRSRAAITTTLPKPASSLGQPTARCTMCECTADAASWNPVLAGGILLGATTPRRARVGMARVTLYK
jgi:hypothetical protein